MARREERSERRDQLTAQSKREREKTNTYLGLETTKSTQGQDTHSATELVRTPPV